MNVVPAQTLLSYSLVARQEHNEDLQLNASRTNEQGQTLHVSASANTRVSSTELVSFQRNHTFVPQGVEKYQAIADQPPANSTSAASNIVNFVAQKLAGEQSDGATAEQLNQRLHEGIAGFKQGYAEAYSELQASGLLTEDVSAAIEQTYQEVLKGFENLAAEYGLASPNSGAVGGEDLSDQVAIGAGVSGLETSGALFSGGRSAVSEGATTATVFSQYAQSLNTPLSLDALLASTELDPSMQEVSAGLELAASRSFDFELTTKDGDVVSIYASSQWSQQQNYAASAASGGAHSSQYTMAENSERAMGFSVDGDLDEDEMRAINELMGQINTLSEQFFQGNITQAFDLALNIGFDSDEIARFSLDLQQHSYVKAEQSYRAVQDQQAPSKGPEPTSITDFVQLLDQAQQSTKALGLERGLIADLMTFMGLESGRDHQQVANVEPVVNSLLEGLEAQR